LAETDYTSSYVLAIAHRLRSTVPLATRRELGHFLVALDAGEIDEAEG